MMKIKLYTLILLLPTLLATSGAVEASSARFMPGARPRSTRVQTVVLYHDGKIARGWKDYSWAPHALSVVAPPGVKGKVMSVAFGSWTGIYLGTTSQFDVRGSYVQITLNGGARGGQRLALALVNGAGNFGVPIPLDLYLPYGALPQKRWVTINVPMEQSLPLGSSFRGVTLQEYGGQPEPVLFVGNLVLHAQIAAHTS